jgi:hypothetical protein
MSEEGVKTKEEWRTTFTDYYASNVEGPCKVNDALMDKWEGKYEKLFEGMQKKYGLPGKNTPQYPLLRACC